MNNSRNGFEEWDDIIKFYDTNNDTTKFWDGHSSNDSAYGVGEDDEWFQEYKKGFEANKAKLQSEKEYAEQLRVSKLTQEEKEIEKFNKEFGLPIPVKKELTPERAAKAINWLENLHEFYKAEEAALEQDKIAKHVNNENGYNFDEDEADELGIEFFTSLSIPLDVLDKQEKESERKNALKRQSYKDLYNSVGVNIEGYYKEIEENNIMEYKYTKEKVSSELLLSDKEKEDMFYSFDKNEDKPSNDTKDDRRKDFKFHYKPSNNLKPRITYQKEVNDKTRYIRYIEIPEYIRFRKDGVYYSTGSKRSHAFVQLSSYGVYSYGDKRVKLFYQPNSDSHDYKLVRSYLATFKYLNNNEKYYEYYMVWLSVYFTDFKDLKSFTRWYRKIRVKREWLRTEIRNIIVDDGYCIKHGLDKDKYQMQKNKEYVNKLNGLLNEQFIMRIYNERKPKYYEIIQDFVEDRHISIAMVKNVLNLKGIHLMNIEDDRADSELLYLIECLLRDSKYGKKINKVTTRKLAQHLLSRKKIDISKDTVSRILKKNNLNLDEINEKIKQSYDEAQRLQAIK